LKYTVSKEFTFEAAHRLLENYNGKCTNNHGHSWLIKVQVESNKLDSKGMVIDFQDLKLLKNWIDDNLDHASILWEKDPMCDYIRQSGQRIFITKGNPTSERIGELILEKAQQLFEKDGVQIRCVEVCETCTSAAIVWGKD
jgi:6-pyruvoyltetrahydropterin/6-carboxytetrahydropterin synthase